MAAVLALGEKAAISHQSAAAIWGMLKPRSGPVHVTVAGNGGRKQRRGIRVHRSHSLIADFVTRPNGIPVTKPKPPSATSTEPLPSRFSDERSAALSTCG